ncbi:unnamed protein product, partial [Mesorhabditis spiculigera]
MCGAISAQSFATDMCVPANIHQHGATIIPHHLHQPMSASTCRITDPRPSDTSNNRSSPQRTAAHARPSAALSRRTGCLAAHRHFGFSSPLYQPRPYR